ncbi:MAG: hypothetical protein U0172_12065 [Nitrospiraceae bacterium]
MDRQDIQTRVHAFANRLLTEAKGDPIRALGLLVLVLEGVKNEDIALVRKLMTEVRRILVPTPAPFSIDPEFGAPAEPTAEQEPEPTPIQHLAGEMSFEGVQHCIRCGKVLARAGTEPRPDSDGFASGYVYQVGSKFLTGEYEDFEHCHTFRPS